MSFDDLPDELLREIGLTCVASYHLADEYYGGNSEDLVSPPSHGLVWCKYWMISPLASVNGRMRRAFLPVLFSDIVLEHMKVFDLNNFIDDILSSAVSLIYRLLLQRSEISQHIRCIHIKVTEDESRRRVFDEAMNRLCDVVTMLSNLTSIHELPFLATRDLLIAVNNHQCLRNVDIWDITRIRTSDIPREYHRSFLSRICLPHLYICVDDGDRYAAIGPTNSYADYPLLNEWLEMGLKIKDTYFSTHNLDQPTLRELRLSPNSLDHLTIALEVDNSLDIAHSIVRDISARHRTWPSPAPAVLLPEINFCAFDRLLPSEIVPSLRPNVLETSLRVSDFTVCELDGSDTISANGKFISSRHWAIVKAWLTWDGEEIATVGVTVSSQMPNIEHLCLESKVCISVEGLGMLAKGLGVLPHLEHLTLRQCSIDRSLLRDYEPIGWPIEFSKADLRIRRRVIGFVLNSLRIQAPKLNRVKIDGSLLVTTTEGPELDRD